MVDFFNVWDVVTSILSLGATFLVAYVYHQLPSNRIKVLRDLLKETEDFYASCVEEGLLKGGDVVHYSARLSALLSRTKDVHLRVKSTQSRFGDVANLLKGVTNEINSVCKDVDQVSVAISTASLRERERLEAERRAAANAQAAQPPTVGVTSLATQFGTTASPDSPQGETPDAAAVSAPEEPHSAVTSSAGEGSSAHPVAPSQEQDGTENSFEDPQMNAPHPMPTQPTPPFTPPRRASNQDSCSESWVSPPNSLPSLPAARDERASCIRSLARFAQQACKRHSVHSRNSDVVYLLEMPSIELAGGSCEEREVPPDSYHA